jgi:hypothetical protein
MNFINRVIHPLLKKIVFIIFVDLAFQFSTALSHYEAEQQALKSSLDANDQLLKQVTNSMNMIRNFVNLFFS